MLFQLQRSTASDSRLKVDRVLRCFACFGCFMIPPVTERNILPRSRTAKHWVAFVILRNLSLVSLDLGETMWDWYGHMAWKKMVEVPEHEVWDSKRIIQAVMPTFHLAAIASHWYVGNSLRGDGLYLCISMIIYANLVSHVVEGSCHAQICTCFKCVQLLQVAPLFSAH